VRIDLTLHPDGHDDELAALVEERAREVARFLRELATKLEAQPEMFLAFRLRDNEGNLIANVDMEVD
jgi:hypothetical protein